MSAPDTLMKTELMEQKTALTAKADVQELDFYYGDFRALKSISMPVYERQVTALIGPSGCGKSTFLRCFNRMHDLHPGNPYQDPIMLQPAKRNLHTPAPD